MTSRGELTKKRILSEATRLFHQKGFGATSINDILSATGLKKGSLYFHFASKEEIGVAVLERASDEAIRFIDSNLVGASPGECLCHYLEAVFHRHETLKFVGGCIFGNTALETGDSDESYGRIVGTLFSTWISKLEEVLAAAQKTGEVRDDLPANMLAHHVISAIEGGIMLARLQKDGRPLRICLDSLGGLLDLRNLPKEPAGHSVTESPGTPGHRIRVHS